MALATLTEMKTHLNITDSTEDSRLTQALNAAIDVAKKRTGRSFESASYSELVYFQDGVGFVVETPLSSLTSVVRDEVEYSVLRSHSNGMIELSGKYTALFTVSYVGGSDTIPDSLKFGILKLAEW